MIVEYLNALKTQKNLSLPEISNLSGVPLQTIQNIFSGRTENPGIVALSAVVYALGGSLDEMMEHQPQAAGEKSPIEILREEYENRIACIKEENRTLLEKINTDHAKEISTLTAAFNQRVESLTDTVKSGDRKVYFTLAITAFLIIALELVGLL